MEPARHEGVYTYHPVSRPGALYKRHTLKLFIERLLPPLPAGAKVCEIGSGRGEFAREICRRGLSYVGCEPSAALREPLQAEGFNVKDCTVPPLPIADASVDLVYTADVVEHLADYRVVQDLVAEALRALKPGGHLAIVAPNFDTLGWLFYRTEYQHAFVTNLHRCRSLVADCGLEIIAARCYMTSLGLTSLRFVDRVLAHTVLPFFRLRAVCALMEFLRMGPLLFRIHKNLCDQVAVIARRPPG